MRKSIFTLIFLLSLFIANNVYAASSCPAGETPQTLPNHVSICVHNNTASAATSATSAGAAAGKMPKVFYVPKMPKVFDINKIPADILDNSSLSQWIWNISLIIMSFGFVYNMYMQLHRLSTGQEKENKSYYQIFMSLFWAFIMLYMWQKEIFFEQYLQMIDSTSGYIWTTLSTNSATTGESTVTNEVLKTITTMTNGGGKTGLVWWDPFTWVKIASLAQKEIEELIITGLLFIMYALYVVFYFIIYLFQILILGLLYAVFPIAVAINVGEYSKNLKILQNWFKWFIEVSTWGIIIGLENVIFNTTVGNYFATSGLFSSATGLSLVVAIG
ncbi:MAG: hypothetical protein ACYCTB_10900, partial [bacterium]